MLKKPHHEYEQQMKAMTDAKATSMHSISAINNAFYWAWCTFRLKYSASLLTVASDKFLASRGTAARVSKATGDEFVAGL